LGVITQRTCRHYIGADADKASILAAAKTAGDIFEAIDTGIRYQWTGAAWACIVPDASIVEAKIGPLACTEGKIGNLSISAGKIQTDAVETLKIKDLNVTPAKASLGFGRYVPRAIVAADFVTVDFGVFDAWQADALDLSAIVPVGAVAAHLMSKIRGTAAGLTFGLRANATTKAWNKIELNTQVANVHTSFVDSSIYIEADRLVDYYIKTNINSVEVAVLGWYI